MTPKERRRCCTELGVRIENAGSQPSHVSDSAAHRRIDHCVCVLGVGDDHCVSMKQIATAQDKQQQCVVSVM